MVGNVGCVRSLFTMRPTSRFLRIRRSSCVSEYPVIRRTYARTVPFSFFASRWYANFPSVRPIHSYASSTFSLLKVALFESFKNSLSCAILTTLSSFIPMVIQPAWYDGRPRGSSLGSLYAGTVLDFSTILRWTRLTRAVSFWNDRIRVMEISELVRTLLAKRGVENDADVAAFLNPDYELHTHDPFLLQGMDVAVARLLSAIDAGERIAVYADFDCDGIPGAALLSDFFNKIGYENFEVYLPHRDREGYGFHTEAISALAARGVKLIITVDVGTTAVDAVAFAKEKGVDVIVTDHHEPIRDPSASNGPGIPAQLPDAVAVLNPKIAPYPFPSLCGAAVAFKLAQAAIQEGRKRGLKQFATIPLGWEKWLLDMVAIATIADMVPLVGENRALAHWGLQVLRKSPRPGIRALCAKLRLRQDELSE